MVTAIVILSIVTLLFLYLAVTKNKEVEVLRVAKQTLKDQLDYGDVARRRLESSNAELEQKLDDESKKNKKSVKVKVELPTGNMNIIECHSYRAENQGLWFYDNDRKLIAAVCNYLSFEVVKD